MLSQLPPWFPVISDSTWVYVVVVGVVGLGLQRALQEALRKATEWRLRRLKVREIERPVPAEVASEAAAEALEEKAKESIQAQFSVTRSLVRPLVLGVTALMILLPFLDQVPAATLSLLVGVVTVLLGIAARPVVENAIAGLVLSYSRTLNLGDTVRVEGHYGTVEDISLTHTTIKVWDWRRYVLPNSKMVAADFLNYTLGDRWVWAYVEFWVAFDADLELVQRLAVEACLSSEALAVRDKGVEFWVMELGKEGVRCWIAGWAEGPPDAWNLAADTRKQLARSLVEAGIPTHSFHHSFGDGAPPFPIGKPPGTSAGPSGGPPVASPAPGGGSPS